MPARSLTRGPDPWQDESMHHPKNLRVCGACGSPAHQDDLTCPTCGASDHPAARAALLLALGLAACGDKDDSDSAPVMAEYGVADTSAYADNDGDGVSEADGDCDDTNAAIAPNATETAGDGVDSNCDG